MGYVLRTSGRHQIRLAVLAAEVFGLTSVPLRRRGDAWDAAHAALIPIWLSVALRHEASQRQRPTELQVSPIRCWPCQVTVYKLV